MTGYDNNNNYIENKENSNKAINGKVPSRPLHAKPFLKSVPIGKLFKFENSLNSAELNLKIKDKARSLSP